MDLNDKLLFTRQAARLAELESWLALLIVAHGEATPTGWRLAVCCEHADELRAQMPRGQLSVAIDYDPASDLHVLNAL